MLSFSGIIHSLKSLKLPSFENIIEILRGWSSAFNINVQIEYAEAVQRGASPNKIAIRLLQVFFGLLTAEQIATLLTTLGWSSTTGGLVNLFLMSFPLLINAWPRATWTTGYFKDFLDNLADWSIYLKSQPIWYKRYGGYCVSGIHWVFKQITIQNPHVLAALYNLDKYFLKICIALILVAYLGLYLLGQNVFVMVAACTLAYGVLDRKNLIPSAMRNGVKKWGWDVALITSLFVGSTFQICQSLLFIPFRLSEYVNISPLIAKILRFFPIVHRYAKEFEDRNRIYPPFDLRCSVNEFNQKLKTLEESALDVTKSHVLDNGKLLPPLLPEIQPKEFLDLFDKIDWHQDHRQVIDRNKARDWRLQNQNESGVSEIDFAALRESELHKAFIERYADLEQNYLNDILYLRNNISIFITRMANKDIHSIKIGGEDLIARFGKAIIALLKEEVSKQQKPAFFVDTLVRVGFETGEYCGIALLRSMQSNYRSNFSEKKDLSLKESVGFVHQFNRERFFQGQYLELARKHNILFAGDVNDTHLYSEMVNAFAPRLGLPNEFSENDELGAMSSLSKDLFSLISSVEKEFWKKTTAQTLEKEIKDAFSTPMLPSTLVDKWYQTYVDEHTVGTEDEKDAVKSESPYTTEFHGTVPVYRLKPAVLHLMMLDCGVLHVEPQEQKAERSLLHPAKVSVKV